jgi:hypothetical protein
LKFQHISGDLSALAFRFTYEKHVNYVLSLVNQRLYLINRLRKTGLSAKAREVIFHSLIISRLLYALPAFAGFLSCADIARFNALFRKSVRWGILDGLFNFDELHDHLVLRQVREKLHAGMFV